MSRDRALVIGIVGLIGCAIGLVLAPRDALIAWLVAWIAWGAIPIGALALLMTLSLIPGTWRAFYARPVAIGASLMPLVAIAMIPLLAGVALIYPWTNPAVTADYAAFKGAWLSTGFFVARTIVYLVVLCAFAWGLLTAEPRLRAAIAAVGVIVYALVGSLIGIDFAETTDPGFHSSIYGLLILAGQWMAALGFGIAVGCGVERKPPGLAAAGVLMVALLAWIYLHAMQFIVIWSADIPDEVVWYLARGTNGWEFVTALLFLAQGIAPFFAMLSPSVRSSPKAMTAIALVTLAMRPVEAAWFILPNQHGGWAAWVLGALALVAMAGLGGAAIAWVRNRRPAWIDGDRFFA